MIKLVVIIEKAHTVDLKIEVRCDRNTGTFLVSGRWKSFIKECGIERGDFLLFSFDVVHKVLKVSIFYKNDCILRNERVVAVHVEGENTNVVEHHGHEPQNR